MHENGVTRVVERYAYDGDGTQFATPGDGCRATDIDCDGVVGAADLVLVRNAIDPAMPVDGVRADVCGNPDGTPDGYVTHADLVCVRDALGQGIPGMHAAAEAGGLRSADDPAPDRARRLHGLPVDHASGLIYARARYYHPKLGRWMRRDPKGYVDGGNLYETFGSNKARFTDPMETFLLELRLTLKGQLVLGGRDSESDDYIQLGYFDPGCTDFVNVTTANGIRRVPTATVAQAADRWIYDPDNAKEWQDFLADKGPRVTDTIESAKIRGYRGFMAVRDRAVGELTAYRQTGAEAAMVVSATQAATDLAHELLTFYAIAPLDLLSVARCAGDVTDVAEASRHVDRISVGNTTYVRNANEWVRLGDKIRSLQQLEAFGVSRAEAKKILAGLRSERQVYNMVTEVGDAVAGVWLAPLDHLGRPTGVTATITEAMINTGTAARQSIRPPGFRGQSAGHARGHLLARLLGGLETIQGTS